MADLGLVFFVACAGFAAAGLIASLYQLVTSQPPRFNFDVDTVVGTIGSVALCLITGPFIIMRNAIRGRRIEGRPLGWLVASSTIAGMWSMFSGLFVVHIAVSIAKTI
ncbi:hypothetical protein JM93_01520 [Roseibium hamelinense]|uniref:Uncharacterized protein n=1 Tax=Roseibium hamelinense TaxID=150831 RepID=A0A562TA03_9HYPH|nr:hypothetical protein [Roseibium hamelinense]MTI45104.1 hypothetical protein [Roseibium hamelinense]TWI90537.1 hypothetical protein JM93_01520 [Roseibium hamelinense]